MEEWDLYTDERKYSGLTTKRGVKVPSGLYRLSAHVVIFNHQNEMLIQRRQKGIYKSLWPNLWDISAGGSVKAGESSKEAAVRETFEELGLNIEINQPAFSFPWLEGISDLYLFKKEIDLKMLKLNKKEVQEVKWASKEEVLYLLKANEFVPYLSEYLTFLFARSKNDNNFIYPKQELKKLL